MTKNPAVLDVNRPLREAIALLAELDVRHLPIVDEDTLVGILSDRDLSPFRDREDLDDAEDEEPQRRELLVSDVMSSDVIVAEPEWELTEVVDTMLEHRVGALPVVAPGTRSVVGIVSYVDVLRAIRPSL